MSQDSFPPLLTRSIEVNAIPAEGTIRRVEASPDERAAIAEAFGLRGVARLAGDVELRRGRRDRISVEGKVEAELTQACVVSLVPVVQTIDEEFDLRLVPEGLAIDRSGPDGEIVIDAFSADPPDTYSGNTIDFGAIVLEHFALAIDPYPRAPDAELPAAATEDGEGAGSAFAALAKIARGRDPQR